MLPFSSLIEVIATWRGDRISVQTCEPLMPVVVLSALMDLTTAWPGSAEFNAWVSIMFHMPAILVHGDQNCLRCRVEPCLAGPTSRLVFIEPAA